MKKSPMVKANSEVLRALRESSGYAIEEVAKKVKATPKKIEATEEGTASFTLTKINKL